MDILLLGALTYYYLDKPKLYNNDVGGAKKKGHSVAKAWQARCFYRVGNTIHEWHGPKYKSSRKVSKKHGVRDIPSNIRINIVNDIREFDLLLRTKYDDFKYIDYNITDNNNTHGFSTKWVQEIPMTNESHRNPPIHNKTTQGFYLTNRHRENTKQILGPLHEKVCVLPNCEECSGCEPVVKEKHPTHWTTKDIISRINIIQAQAAYSSNDVKLLTLLRNILKQRSRNTTGNITVAKPKKRNRFTFQPKRKPRRDSTAIAAAAYAAIASAADAANATDSWTGKGEIKWADTEEYKRKKKQLTNAQFRKWKKKQIRKKKKKAAKPAPASADAKQEYQKDKPPISESVRTLNKKQIYFLNLLQRYSKDTNLLAIIFTEIQIKDPKLTPDFFQTNFIEFMKGFEILLNKNPNLARALISGNIKDINSAANATTEAPAPAVSESEDSLDGFESADGYSNK